MNYQTLKVELAGDRATLTLNRPEKRNAISTRMIEEIVAALDAVEKSAARVVVLTGAGQAFCAGMDLEGLQHLAAQSRDQNLEDSRRMAHLFHRVYSFPRITIAAVNGAAIAGGCGLATLADFTLAVPAAKFGYTEVKIGFLPAIVSVFLSRQIGEKRARDLLLTGRILDAEESFRMGLVTEIVPAERLEARVDDLVVALLAVSPTSLARTKALLLRRDADALARELEHAVHANADIRSTADFREGLAAFLEKRAPHWRGH